jgi:hypothetical protein
MIKLTEKQWEIAKKNLSEHLINQITLDNAAEALSKEKKEPIKIETETPEEFDNIPVVGIKLNDFYAMTPAIDENGLVLHNKFALTHLPTTKFLVTEKTKKYIFKVWSEVKNMHCAITGDVTTCSEEQLLEFKNKVLQYET